MTCEEKRKSNIEELKEKKESQVRKSLLDKPIISDASKNLVQSRGEDVYSRCIKFKEENEKKKQEKVTAKEEKKKKEEDAIIQGVKSKKMRESKINVKVQNLMDWEEEKKKKLGNLQKKYEMRGEVECTFKPKVNAKSAVKSKELNSVTARLYNDDIEKRNRRHSQLETEYTPSFEPEFLNKYKSPKHPKENSQARSLTPKFDKNNATKEEYKHVDVAYKNALGSGFLHDMMKSKFHKK